MNGAVVSDEVRGGVASPAPYWIYLRSFSVTGSLRGEELEEFDRAARRRHPKNQYGEHGESVGVEIPIATGRLDPLGTPRSSSELNPEWEAVIEKGVREFASLVALGAPGEAIGAGRVQTTDAEWERILFDLASRAAGFFVIPDRSPGVRRELEWLKTRGYRDCVFFMPPRRPGTEGRASWSELQRILAPLLSLPHDALFPSVFAYDGSGRAHIVSMANSLAVSDGRPRYFINAVDLESALRELLPYARWQDEQVTDGVVDRAGQFCGSLMASREPFDEGPGITEELRTALRRADTEEMLAALAAFGAPMHHKGNEQLFHWTIGPLRLVVVRVTMSYGDSARIGYVTFADGGTGLIIAFQLIEPEAEEQILERWDRPSADERG